MQSDNESERQGAISEWHTAKEQILGVMLRVFTTELRDTYLTTVIEQVGWVKIFFIIQKRVKAKNKLTTWCILFVKGNSQLNIHEPGHR